MRLAFSAMIVIAAAAFTCSAATSWQPGSRLQAFGDGASAALLAVLAATVAVLP